VGSRPLPRSLHVSALSLCGYFSIKHNAELAAACNKIYGPAIKHLAKNGESRKIRGLCRRAARVGDELVQACKQL
jgi:hypothetical protein